MLRRNARLRQEYLYRKSLEGKALAVYERKKAVKSAIESGKALTPDERSFEARARKDMSYETLTEDARAGDGSGRPLGGVDDEYAFAGSRDPKVLVTSSRDPSSRLGQFVKELRLLFPNSQRMNRGSYVMGDIISAAKGADFTDVIIAHEHRGEPDGMIICHLPHGPTAYFGLSGTVLRHDIPNHGTMPGAYPHIITEGFTSELGNRTATILKHLFPVPNREDSKRIVTFANSSDWISFRHHLYSRKRAGDGPEGAAQDDVDAPGGIVLKELGPRFEMRLYQIKLGTVDIKEADNEFVLRPYMNSARTRDFL